MRKYLKPLLVTGALLAFNTFSAQQTTKVFTSKTEFTELADPTQDTLIDWSKLSKGLHVSFASIDRRFAKHQIPDIKNQKETSLTGWKGERVSAQLLLWTGAPLPQVKVEVGAFKNNKQSLPEEISHSYFERYVMTDEFAGGCGYRKPEDFAASLSPDMLDDLPTMDLVANAVRPVWVSVDIPRTAPAGTYNTKVKIFSKGKKLAQLNLQLKVVNRILPPPSEWTYHLDMWQHPAAVARVNKVKVWSDEHFRLMKPIMKHLADAGQKVITTTLNKDPWNIQTYDPYADMIIWTKNADGSWAYDYSVFDRWVSLMLSLGINDMINAYSIIPWNEEIHYKDASTGKFVDVKATPGTQAFAEYWTPFLKDFSRHLKEKGWLKITNIALDERAPEQMAAAFSLIKKVAPELGVAYADNHKTYKKYPDSRDVSIAAGHPFSRQDLVERRKKGLNTTFYIYCGNDFPNTFTFSQPAEAAYQAWYAMANGFDGVLRWSYNSWVKNPLRDSRFRSWPAGDTYIVYPQNRSSIRFERLREGIQDYEKLRIIKQELKENNRLEDLQKLNEVIQKFSSAKRSKTWNEDLNAAKRLLNSF